MPFGSPGSGQILAEEHAKAKRSRRGRPKSKPKKAVKKPTPAKKTKKSVRKRAR